MVRSLEREESVRNHKWENFGREIEREREKESYEKNQSYLILYIDIAFIVRNHE